MTENELTLIHCLLEEFTTGGGNFASPDTDFLFRQRFGGFSETTSDIFKRLLKSPLQTPLSDDSE
jgi:hypothetical protein